jgi:hypothetical protein
MSRLVQRKPIDVAALLKPVPNANKEKLKSTELAMDLCFERFRRPIGWLYWFFYCIDVGALVWIYTHHIDELLLLMFVFLALVSMCAHAYAQALHEWSYCANGSGRWTVNWHRCASSR